MKTNIIPSLKEIKQTNTGVTITDYSLSDEYRRLVPVAEETFLNFKINPKGTKTIIAVENKSLSEGAYKISIQTEKITVEYSEYSGAYYGIVTLCQLSVLNNNLLSVSEISDYPDMNMRSISDDISRGQVSSLENFKSIIRRLSYWKYNMYFPYIEDTYDFKFLPSKKENYAMPEAEWRELCEYGRRYGVTVRPLFNLLCHFKSSSVPEYYPYVLHSKNGNPIGCIDPLAPNIREFVCKMLDEIVDAFGVGIVHAGGDEAAILAEIYGKETAEVIYCDYMNMLDEELKKRGCSLMIYGDMIYTAWGDYAYGFNALQRLNRDITIVYWAYWSEKEFPDIMKFVDDNRRTAISPASRSYGRFMPAYISYENMRYICNYSKGNVNSLIVSSWNDDGAILREENMVAFAFGGEFGWDNGSSRTYEDLLDVFLITFYGLENINLEYFKDIYHFETNFTEPDVNKSCEISSFICREFWKSITKPTTTEFGLHDMAGVLEEKFGKAYGYLAALRPTLNSDTYDCFLFDIRRMLWGIRRANLFPTEQLENDAVAKLISEHPELLSEHKKMHTENEKLWMHFNRRSEWNRLDNMYNRLEKSIEDVMLTAENK